MRYEKETKPKCALCGKEISTDYDFSEYAYKINGKTYCSWTCYRKVKKYKKKVNL